MASPYIAFSPFTCSTNPVRLVVIVPPTEKGADSHEISRWLVPWAVLEEAEKACLVASLSQLELSTLRAERIQEVDHYELSIPLQLQGCMASG